MTLFLFLLLRLGLRIWLPLLSPRSTLPFAFWLPFCSSIPLTTRRSLKDDAGIAFLTLCWLRVCCCCCVGVFLGVFCVDELSRVGVWLGVLSPPGHSGEVCLGGLPSFLTFGELALLLGDVGSDDDNGGGSGVVGIIALLGLWIILLE